MDRVATGMMLDTAYCLGRFESQPAFRPLARVALVPLNPSGWNQSTLRQIVIHVLIINTLTEHINFYTFN